MDSPKDNPKDSSVSILWIIIPSILILAIVFLYPIIIHYIFDVSHADKGTYGDSFGALNTLFSGLAFAVLIYTMMLQRKELALQREELEETRKELAKSAAAQESTQKALNVQVAKLNQTAILNGSVALMNYKRDIGSGYEGLVSYDLARKSNGEAEMWADNVTSIIQELEEDDNLG